MLARTLLGPARRRRRSDERRPRAAHLAAAERSPCRVLEIAELAGGATPVGFINSFGVTAPVTTLERLRVHHIDALPHGPRDALVIGGVVSNRRRTGIEALERLGYRFATLVHPAACLSRRGTLQPGCVVSSGAQIAAYAALGPHVIVDESAAAMLP